MSKKSRREIDAALDSVCGEGTAAKIEAIAAQAELNALATKPTNQPSLSSLAKLANEAFARVETLATQTHDTRLQAGQYLAQAKAKIEADPSLGKFAEWLKLNIKRSKGDCYKCMAMAKALDPVAARQAEKDANAEAAKTARAAPVSDVRDKPTALAANTAPVSKALAAINSAQAKPNATVWNEPASVTRNATVASNAGKLSTLTGPSLRREVEDQIRILSDVRWDSITEPGRRELAGLIRKMLTRIEAGTV
jgi:hypothetical protein